MTQLLTWSTTLATLSCGECSIPFAIPEDMKKARLKDGQKFWCPNGHGISWSKTEADRLREPLEAEQRRVIRLRTQVSDAWDYATQEREAKKTAQRSAAAHKGQATKLRKRIGAGVCPVDGCRRHFQNVDRHIANKHPDFAGSDS